MVSYAQLLQTLYSLRKEYKMLCPAYPGTHLERKEGSLLDQRRVDTFQDCTQHIVFVYYRQHWSNVQFDNLHMIHYLHDADVFLAYMVGSLLDHRQVDTFQYCSQHML
jgi:hypothetical protein